MRNCWNLELVCGGGEPGGEGGMSRLGTEGRVRSWMRLRVVVYGDEGADVSGGSGRSGGLDSGGGRGELKVTGLVFCGCG